MHVCLRPSAMPCVNPSVSVRLDFFVCLSEASGSVVNGANWPSELFAVKRKRKPPGMYRGRHAIYLGYGWFLKLARGTSMHAHVHTHIHRDTPAFCLKRKSTPLLPRLKHKHTSKVSPFFFFILLFLEEMQPLLPCIYRA